MPATEITSQQEIANELEQAQASWDRLMKRIPGMSPARAASAIGRAACRLGDAQRAAEAGARQQ